MANSTLSSMASRSELAAPVGRFLDAGKPAARFTNGEDEAIGLPAAKVAELTLDAVGDKVTA